MPELPTTFGKYFLTEKLATGGMAEIYLGKIVGPGGFEKQLVIKQIHPKLSGNRHFVDLFVAEAKTLVTLAHGNIVPVYELGVVDDTYFIAMEYIDGPTLYRLTETLARRDVVMAPAVAAWIGARIVEGLDYAHRKGEGVIHRDLSPRNVMLSRDGEVKLVDFGIAVTLGSVEDDRGQSAPTGSFPYMSPEQVRKEPLSGQTDLFSVGVLLWEMLVGHRLFARSDPDATLAAVTDLDIPHPSDERPEIATKLGDVVMRALERDKTARWATAGEMLAALQRYLYALEDTPTPRDVAALVARFCPPETRRLPTHADGPFEPDPGEPGVDRTTPNGNGPPLAPPDPPLGPRTAVIPRDQEAHGKRPIRQKTFATHVAFDNLLERTPDAPDDGDLPPTTVGPSTSPRPAGPTQPPETPDTTMRIPGRSAPSQALLVFAGIGATGLAIAAIVVFLRGRAAVLAPDAAPRYDVPFYVHFDTDAPDPDGGIALDAGAGVDGPDRMAAADAAGTRDASGLPTGRDAGDRPRDGAERDAGTRPRPDADRPGDASAGHPTGTATLKIGADPWGEVVIDGVKQSSRTPLTVVVSAGHHVVDVVFGGDDPPRTKTTAVDLASGDTRELQVDFTKP